MRNIRGIFAAILLFSLLGAAGAEQTVTIQEIRPRPASIRIVADGMSPSSGMTIRANGTTVRLLGRFPSYSVTGRAARPTIVRRTGTERTTYRGRVILQFYQDGRPAIEVVSNGAIVERRVRGLSPTR